MCEMTPRMLFTCCRTSCVDIVPQSSNHDLYLQELSQTFLSIIRSAFKNQKQWLNPYFEWNNLDYVWISEAEISRFSSRSELCVWSLEINSDIFGLRETFSGQRFWEEGADEAGDDADLQPKRQQLCGESHDTSHMSTQLLSSTSPDGQNHHVISLWLYFKVHNMKAKVNLPPGDWLQYGS